MTFDFTASMTQATDADIIRIVTTDRDNYQLEALQAAEHEFTQRGLSPDYVAQLKSVNAAEQSIIDRKANEPLDIGLKVAAFLIPVILMGILAATFKRDGYDRKARELAIWTFYGLGFYVILVLLTVA